MYKNMKINLLFVVACIVAYGESKSLAPEKEPVYKNMGKNECENIQGDMETCGYLQFCSKNQREKGCRNCTDIADIWCNEDIDEFRKKFPTCEILCERQDLKKAGIELNATGRALQTCENNTQKLKEELHHSGERERAMQHERDRLSDDKTTLTTILTIVGTLFAVCLCVLVAFLRLKLYRAQNHNVGAKGTATRQRWWCCKIFPGSKLPTQPTDQESLPESVPLTGTHVPTTDYQPTDSGHSSNQTLQSMTAPNGGTEHHPQDVQDFMQGYQPTDSGQGSNQTLQNLIAPNGGTEHHPQDVQDFMLSQGVGQP